MQNEPERKTNAGASAKPSENLDAKQNVSSQSAEVLAKKYDDIVLRYETPRAKSSKKKKILKAVLLIALFALSFYLLFGISGEWSGGAGIDFSTLAKKTNLWALSGILLAVMLLLIGLQTAKFCYINKVTIGKTMLRTAAKINLLGKYYDNLTPSQSGGQPFQMYYMAKRGVSPGLATAIPTINYIIQMYAWQLVTLVILIINGNYIYSAVNTGATTIAVLAWVGWSINMFVPVLLLMVTVSPKTAHKLSRLVIRIGYRLKIVKNYKKTLRKTYSLLDDYREALKIMGGQIKHCLGIAAVSTIEYLLMLTIPLIIANFIGGVEANAQNWLNMATLYCYSNYAVSFMPTPGGAGFAEVSTSLAFSGIDGGVTKWMVLFLRLVIYYSYVFIGFIIIAYDFLKSWIKERRVRKNEKEKTR